MFFIATVKNNLLQLTASNVVYLVILVIGLLARDVRPSILDTFAHNSNTFWDFRHIFLYFLVLLFRPSIIDTCAAQVQTLLGSILYSITGLQEFFQTRGGYKVSFLHHFHPGMLLKHIIIFDLTRDQKGRAYFYKCGRALNLP